MIATLIFGLVCLVGFAGIQLYNVGKSVFDR